MGMCCTYMAKRVQKPGWCKSRGGNKIAITTEYRLWAGKNHERGNAEEARSLRQDEGQKRKLQQHALLMVMTTKKVKERNHMYQAAIIRMCIS